MILETFMGLRHWNPIKTLHCQDKHWEECIPKEIPYTIAAEKYKKKEFEGSAQVQSLNFDQITFNLRIPQATLDIKEADKEYSYMYHTRWLKYLTTP